MTFHFITKVFFKPLTDDGYIYINLLKCFVLKHLFAGFYILKKYRLLCTQRSWAALWGFQAGSNMFKQRDLSTRWTGKDFKGTVVNRTLPSLHEGSLEITLTVPLRQVCSFFLVNIKIYIIHLSWLRKFTLCIISINI